MFTVANDGAIAVVRGFALAIGWILTLVGVASAQHRARADSEELSEDARRLGTGDRLRIEDLRLGESGEAVDLVLDPFEVFAPDTVVTVHGEGGIEKSFAAPSAVHFRGAIAGEPESNAFVSFHHDGFVRGVISRGDDGWIVVPSAEGVVAERAVATGGGEALCGNATHPLVAPGGSPKAMAQRLSPIVAASAIYDVRIAVETDFEFLQLFSGDPSAAAQYVGDVFAYMSTLYEDALGTRIEIASISLWETSDDPWDQSSTTCQLMQFSRFWNHEREDVPRSIAHMLSGRPLNGGAAWTASLCSAGFVVDHGGACPGLTPRVDDFGGGYGFTGNLEGDFNINSPEVVRDIVFTSHEVGHNFGSPHSHCYAGVGGNSSDVDHCSNVQNTCYAGPTSLPGLDSTVGGTPGAGNGTIMSYCHLLPGGLGNITLTLGDEHPYGVAPERIPALMRAHVESVAQENPSCLAIVTPTPTMTPIPTRTPVPTMTPLPTPTPRPTRTARPTRTPPATRTPPLLPTQMPTPTGSPTPGDSTVGLYDPLASVFFLRNRNDPGHADLTFQYGPAGSGWIPIVGDWDGDGRTTVGLFDASLGTFFLRNSNDAGFADVVFAYGPRPSRLVPIIGDWSGDGMETVGLYDPASGGFYLRNRHAGGEADVHFRYGPAGDRGWIPIAGDWDGDGDDTVGLFDPHASNVYLRNVNRAGYADVTFAYGPVGAGLDPLAGDWNSDAVDTIALFEPEPSRFHMRNRHAGGVADLAPYYGPPGSGWLPLVGDWDAR